MALKNVVFDIGNVIVKWAPSEIIANHFPNHPDAEQLTKDIFKSQTWLDLNLSKITEEELVDIYHKKHSIEKDELTSLMIATKESLTPITGSFELIDFLYDHHIPLFIITDNTHGILSHLKQKYDCWSKFKDLVTSAEIGILKPNIEIYQHLLNKNNLVANECIFLDDLIGNVEGAIKAGMEAHHFTTADIAKDLLRSKLNI